MPRIDSDIVKEPFVSDEELDQRPGESDEAWATRIKTDVSPERQQAYVRHLEDRAVDEQMVQKEDETDEQWVSRIKSTLSPEQQQKLVDKLNKAARQEELEQITEREKEVRKAELEQMPAVKRWIISGAAGLSKGVAAEFLDEAAALGSTVAKHFDKIADSKEFWKIYEEKKARVKGTVEAELEDSPYISTPAYLGGTVWGWSKFAKAVPALTGGTVLKSAMSDFVYGTAMGVGQSEASFVQGDYRQVMQDAADMGVQGAGLGLAMRYVGIGGGWAVRQSKTKVANYIVEGLSKTSIGFNLSQKLDNIMKSNRVVESILKRTIASEKQNLALLEKQPVAWAASNLSDDEVKLLSSNMSKQMKADATKFVHEHFSFGVGEHRELFAQRWLAAKVVEREAQAFNKWNWRSMQLGEFGKFIEREGYEFAERRFDDYRKAKHALGLIVGAAGSEAHQLKRFCAWIADGRYVLKAMDEKWGTKLTPALDELEKKNIAYQTFYVAAQQDIKQLNKMAKKVGLLDEVSWVHPTLGTEATTSKLYAALESKAELGNIQDPKQLQVLYKWQEWFEAQRKMANELGMNIPRFETEVLGYVPNKTVGTDQYITKLREGLEQFEDALDKPLIEATPKELGKLVGTDKEFAFIKTNIQEITGITISSGKDLYRALDELKALRSFKPAKITRATAALEREGALPLFIRETNVAKLADKWVHSTFRHEAYRDALSQFRGIANVLKDKDEVAATWLNNWADDITGIRTGTVAQWTKDSVEQHVAYLNDLVERTSNPALKVVYRGVRDVPEFMSWATKNIYSAAMGLSVKAFLRQLSQPFIMTTGEIGGTSLLGSTNYGLKQVFKGQMTALGHMFSGVKVGDKTIYGPRALREFLSAKNLQPPRLTFESFEEVRSGMRSVLGKASDGLADFSLMFFTFGETWNRTGNFWTGQALGKNLVEGLRATFKGGKLTADQAKVFEMIKGFEPGYRLEFKDLAKRWKLTKGSKEAEQAIMDKMSLYLISKTQFNYSRIALSQFGRDMGYMFSMFTKWPLSIGADIVTTVKSRSLDKQQKAVSIFKKYFGPAYVMLALDKLVLDEGFKKSDSTQRLLIGSTGLSGMSPIQSVVDMYKKGWSYPPIVSMITDVTSAIVDPEKAPRLVNRAVTQWNPLGSYMRFMMQDWQLIKGEKPEKIEDLMDYIGM